MRQTVLIVDDDRFVSDALATALQREGRTVVVCSDIESAEIALRRFAVTDLVSDVQFSGIFGFEGLHFLGRVRQIAPACRIVLMTGYGTDPLRDAAMTAGADAFLSKPFEISALEAALGPAGDGAAEVLTVASLDEILSKRMVTTKYQPIVAVGSGKVPFGFEALTRLEGGWAGGGPAELFEYAAARGRLPELNRAAASSAIEAARDLPQESLIFINIDPQALSDRRLVEEIVAASTRSGIDLGRIVIEITERSSVPNDAASLEVFGALRAMGVRFALDDHGSAYSHLINIAIIRPSFIKIAGAFGTGFESDANKKRVVSNVAALARSFDCATVLEGVESEATARAAAGLGIELAQGYFFSRPRESSYWSAS